MAPPGPPVMIVEGRGMLATAFLASRSVIEATLFARGVADSKSADHGEYGRERSTLVAALDAAATRDHPLVYFSSGAVYGHFGDDPVAETAPTRPVTAYGRHKVTCESLVRASHGPSLIVRLPNVVGPGGNPHQLVPSLVSQVLTGRVSVLRGAGRDLIDVDDVVATTAGLIDAGAPARLVALDRTINVASGICTPVIELVGMISTILGCDPEIEVVDGGDPQRLAVDRLHDTIPTDVHAPDYVIRVLERRVPAIAAQVASTIPLSRASAI